MDRSYFVEGVHVPDGRYLAPTAGWSQGPDHPFEVLVSGMASDELDRVYVIDEPNAVGGVSWWPE